MRKKRVLVTHPWMGRGGSEATAMWTLQALQYEYDITLVTASPIDWDELNECYGSSVSPDRITVVRAPRLPTVNGPLRLVHAQLRYFERFCFGMAKKFDLCISAYNPIDFGRPSIQLIGDFSFSEEMRKMLSGKVDPSFCHKATPLRKLYLWFSRKIGLDSFPLRERRDLVLANSAWSQHQLAENFGVPRSPIIFPPVILPTADENSERDPFGFVCLGRIVPEKEIERVISILKEVREHGLPVTLRLIGGFDEGNYSQKIAELVSRENWIKAEGFLSLDAKQKVLASQSFGLHACKNEAFGIAVAEIASMGCVPFVPDTGGAGEIVPVEELQFCSNEDAVRKIVVLLQNPERVKALRELLTKRMGQYGPEVFMRDLREHVIDFAGFRKVPANVPSPKNLAAIK